MSYALDNAHNLDDVNGMGKIVLRCFDKLGDLTQKHGRRRAEGPAVAIVNKSLIDKSNTQLFSRFRVKWGAFREMPLEKIQKSCSSS